jgi:hypothetical protein
MFQCAIALLGLTLAGCTRPSSSAQIQLSLPQSLSQHSMDQTAQSDPNAGQVLSHVVINITGDGITTPILHTWDDCSDCSPATTVPSTLGIDNIPQGQSRLVQVIAVYKNSTSNSMDVYYGDSTMDLTSPTVTANINVATVSTGTVINGRVMGRYLTGANTGPTGMLNVFYNPGGGKPRMLVDQSQIVNGWMNTMMLSNIKLDFITKETDGTMQELWSLPVSLESTVFSTSNFVAKAGIPVNIRKSNQNGTPIYEPNDATVYVWGYFGNSTYTSSKNVCVDTSLTLQNLKIFTATAADYATQSSLAIQTATLPNVDALASISTPLHDVYFQGGLVSTSTPCTSATTPDIFTNVLKVSTTLIDGNGNDNAAGFQVPLAPMADNSIVLSSGTPTQILTGQLLPGAQSVISAVQLYKKVSTNNSHDDLGDCDQIAAGVGGYVPGGAIGVVNASTGAFSINTNIGTNDNVSGVLCPVYSPPLQSRRLGVWLDSHVFQSSSMSLMFTRPIASSGPGVGGNLLTTLCEPVTLHRQSGGTDMTTGASLSVAITTSNPNLNLYDNAACSGGIGNTATVNFPTNSGTTMVFIKENAIFSTQVDTPFSLTATGGGVTGTNSFTMERPLIKWIGATITSSSCTSSTFVITRPSDDFSLNGTFSPTSITWSNTNPNLGVYSTAGDCAGGTNIVTGGAITTISPTYYMKNLLGSATSVPLNVTIGSPDMNAFGGTLATPIVLTLSP